MQNWIDNSFHEAFGQEWYLGSLVETSTNPSFDLKEGDQYTDEALIIRDMTYTIYFDITSDILENDPYQIIPVSSIENYLRVEEDISIDTDKHIDELFVCDEKPEQKQKDRTEFIKQEQLQLISNRNPDHHRLLWDQCENCFIPNYKKVLKSNMQVCEECGSYFKMTSSDRIDLLIDEGTWTPLDQDMGSLDPIQFDSGAELESAGEFIEEWNEEIYQYKLSKDLKEGQALEIAANLIEEPWLPEYVKPTDKAGMDEKLTKPDLDEGGDIDQTRQRHQEWDTYIKLNTPQPWNPEGNTVLEGVEESQREEEWIRELYEDKESQDDEGELNEDEESQGEETNNEEKKYGERLNFYKKETGLLDAVQTGVGQLNGLPVALGVMDSRFLAGSMGCVVGEKITRLIEYATKNLLPLIIVSASGGARVHEGSLSLMQMAKISAALYDYQFNKRLFYLSIITSPTTGGVTASFAMLGDIIITEPGTFVAFAGPRVVQQILNETIPEEEQEAESLFEKGFFDFIVPRHLLKSVISELFKLHGL
uniref:acetyl-CoA carboxylase carboxyltransferase beta subunit n=1 Tax=Cuscuta volcanica TaxID=1423681 RepID=UPI002435E233|nr:acetyl-CoA carboxylase carboxyltransferase beta subunit [Cuscuta volcanica]WEY30225.1 acetyl-CoA carboxylase carboxyltransferase beta subunit [Cuscuta volcanica]